MRDREKPERLDTSRGRWKVSRHVGAETEFLRGSDHYRRRRRHRGRGHRCDAGTSEVKVSRGWPRKITTKRRKKTSTTTCPSFRSSRPRAPITLRYFVGPWSVSSTSSVPSADERNKVYSFRGSRVPSSLLRHISLLPADRRTNVKRFSRNCKKTWLNGGHNVTLDVRGARETWKLDAITPVWTANLNIVPSKPAFSSWSFIRFSFFVTYSRTDRHKGTTADGPPRCFKNESLLIASLLIEE